MTDASFSWIPIYKEIAAKLLGWRNKQAGLLEILKAAMAEGYRVGNLNDQDKQGRQFSLKVIDPFTFFATFNRKVSDDSRIGILKVIKERFELASQLPTDFKGVPVMHPQKSWFFSFEPNREKYAIDALWDFAESIVTKEPEQLPPELFERCLSIRMVGIGNLTMGMFWMRPDTFIALDSRNSEYLRTNGIQVKVDNWKSYLTLREDIKVRMPGITWPELSHKAYQNDNDDKRYWLFQANPDHYDLIGALRESVVQTWQTRQHKNHS